MNKTPTIMVAITVRLFAIGLAVYLLSVLFLEFAAAATTESYEANLALGLFFVLVVLLVFFLWRFPLFVASKILSFDSTEVPESSISEESIYNLGLVLLGVYLLYVAISDTVYWSYHISQMQNLTLVESLFHFTNQAAIASTVAEFVMAVFLIAGSKPISRFILKIRRAGT